MHKSSVFWPLLVIFGVHTARAGKNEIAALKEWPKGVERLNKLCEQLDDNFKGVKCTLERATWEKVLTPEWFEKTGESMSYNGVAADRCGMAITDFSGHGSYSCFVSTLPSKVACRDSIIKATKSVSCRGKTGNSSLALEKGTLVINAGDDAGQDVWDLQEIKRLFPECAKRCN